MKTKLEQAVDYRLAEMRDLFRSGLSELTGKARKTRDASGQIEYVGGRFGGVKSSFPELRHVRQSPKVLAAAIERGSGKVYRDLRDVVTDELGRYIPASKSRKERLSVTPHDALTRKCRKCGQLHSKSSHRFHGRGAWLQTHLFPFRTNPGGSMTLAQAKQYVTYYTGLIRHGMPLVKEEKALLIRARQVMRMARRPKVNPRGVPKRRTKAAIRRRFKRMYDAWDKSGFRKRAKKKANPGRPVIYHRLLRIEARKGPGHRCDAACRKANHSYFHDFTAGAVVYGMPDGSVLVKSNQGKRLWKYF